MKKIDTPVIVHLTISVNNVHIEGNSVELSQPIAPKNSGRDKLSLLLSMIKSLEVVAPGIPAIVDLIRKAA